MKAFLVLLALVLTAFIFTYSSPTTAPVDPPKPARATEVPWDQRGSAITPGGPIIREWVVNYVSSDLYNHNFILEFEPDGRPFQTTQTSKAANRINRVKIINLMKVAATRQDKQIAADINLAQVAWDAGGTKDRDDATNKLFDDLIKIKITGNEAISYDSASPWGQIIASLERRLADNDKLEAKDNANERALNDAKRAAGAR
ncbi:MAG: hypothetical protein HYX37_15175 [Rhizobiales bacterium]|nr:hypothetical protein [Hyphomicrobiales bacterium]